MYSQNYSSRPSGIYYVCICHVRRCAHVASWESYHSSRKPSLQACTLDVDELLNKCEPIVVDHLQENQ